jgi:glycogen debranching enzyme
MLRYVAQLHVKSVQPARAPLPYDWEEIGPGYCYGPAFGHWDIVHQVMDVLPYAPEHAKRQLLNNLANQREDGFLPGSIWMREEPMDWPTTGEPSGTGPSWSPDIGHPPLWPAAVDVLYKRTGDLELLRDALAALRKQLAWFDVARRADPEGYFYADICARNAECGIDQSLRFEPPPGGNGACIDASSHVAWCTRLAAGWAEQLGQDSAAFDARANELEAFIRDALFDDQTGWFLDHWQVGLEKAQLLTFEGVWPLVAGQATASQAARLIDEHLLNEEEFLTTHPIATTAKRDPSFELRMWRGPSWNSMTWWAATGCARYGRADAAAVILERALDACAKVYAETGTIWEFYHPLGGSPEDVERKPNTQFRTPCRDYLGHNPMLAMARLWETEARREEQC